MIIILLLAAALGLGSLSGLPLSDGEKDEMLNKKSNIAAFYNMFASGPDFQGIVRNQVDTIKGSGLLDRLDYVFYATMGAGGDAFTVEEPKFVHIAHYGDQGEEIQTLSMLYQYCFANPKSKVLYFHDKGSYHHSYANVKICAILNCYVLNPYCIDALDNHDTCGWRISPTPYIHYSGNFWWARCSYINTLIDPMAPRNNQTYIAQAETLNDCVGVKGRYFAETWIGTGPTIYPADCMNATIDTSYVWGYKFPFAADNYCHGANIPSGLPCQTASTFENVELFKHAINTMNSLIPVAECRDNRKEVIRRSQIMYGEDPHTYMEWMDRLFGAVKLADNTLIRCAILCCLKILLMLRH
jgi:hypothetical protein